MGFDIKDVQAIDVHAHYGPYIHVSNQKSLYDEWCTQDAATVARWARAANTRLTIVSPFRSLLPRGAAVAERGNDEAEVDIPPVEGLAQWVVVHPLQPHSYEQAIQRKDHPKCMGIKIHPEEHCYPIVEHGRKIFQFAADHDLVILTHSGEQRSMPEDFIPFANDFPQVKLILAHLGCGWDEDPSHQVRAIQRSKHGNVYVDTSSARSIFPGLIEFGVKELGAGRLLYGTDSPLYSPILQRARIDSAEIRDEDKRAILCGNAEKLFNL